MDTWDKILVLVLIICIVGLILAVVASAMDTAQINHNCEQFGYDRGTRVNWIEFCVSETWVRTKDIEGWEAP